jgi:DNA-binding transcriptional MerR regulator
MRIGAMSRRTRVSQRLLRYYEEQGLLRPARLASGHRVYTESDVATVRHTRVLLAAGVGTRVIARLLPCIRDDIARMVPTCPDMITALRLERERIALAIGELRESQRILDAVLEGAS